MFVMFKYVKRDVWNLKSAKKKLLVYVPVFVDVSTGVMCHVPCLFLYGAVVIYGAIL